MIDTSLATVRRVLLDRYDDIKHRLTARLGSPDLAADALQDAWLKIDGAQTLGTVRDPGNYIFGIAMNAARDRMREMKRRPLTQLEIDELLEIPDDAPGPAQEIEARSDLRMLESILSELTPRQREILIAARLHGTRRPEIARRLGISLRLVEKELQFAQEYCLSRRRRIAK
jgi:RNA polymerase sigma factor (sigma-70 family)